ncbi:MAG: alpha/beta hydrolase, partial [Verrucomicrobiota bacterium]|nr:alpha/beta hydrolase [Verrucomicrobiota bacterium]
ESRILLLGKSLGGGVSSQVAANQKVAGLILHSTFTSLPDLANELFPWLPVKSLSKMQFNTRSHLEHVTAPVMIIHSREDQLIGFQHAAANKAACPHTCHLVEIGGDHNDLESPRAFALKEGLDTFMKQITSHPDQHPPTPSQP